MKQKLEVKKEEVDEEKLKAKARATSIKEGSAYSFMDGFGLRYVSPYALALGANNTQIGLLSSVPGLLGNLSQLFGSKLVEKISRKKIVIWSVFLQAFMWLPLIFVGWLYFSKSINSFWASSLVVIIYSLLTLFGAFGGPAWNSWMRDLVGEKRGSYFGKRNKTVGIFGLVCGLAGGLILGYFQRFDVFLGFLILFFIAFLGRSTSGYLFTRAHEPKLSCKEGYYFSFWQFLKKMTFNNYGRFVLFTGLISLAVAIASPFFVIYELKDLNLGYWAYTAITLSSAVTSLLSMAFWGRLTDKYGNVLIMKITGFFVAFIPLYWLLSIFVPKGGLLIVFVLMCFEGFSGFVWAGFNLSTGMFPFFAVTRERMAICVAYDSLINAIGAFAGAILGGYLSSSNLILLGLSPILSLFVISGVARLLSWAMLLKVKEVKPSERLEIKQLSSLRRIWRYLMVRRTEFDTGSA